MALRVEARRFTRLRWHQLIQLFLCRLVAWAVSKNGESLRAASPRHALQSFVHGSAIFKSSPSGRSVERGSFYRCVVVKCCQEGFIKIVAVVLSRCVTAANPRNIQPSLCKRCGRRQEGLGGSFRGLAAVTHLDKTTATSLRQPLLSART